MAFDPKSQITRNDPRYAQSGGLWNENGEWNALDPWLNDPGLQDSYWRNLGYTGQVGTQATDQADPQISPELRQWLATQGYQNSTDGGQSDGFNALMDQSGNVVPGSEYGNRTNDDATFIAGLAALGGAGYAAGAFGGAGAGAGEAAGAAAGETAAASGAGTISGGSGLTMAGTGAGGTGSGLSLGGSAAGGTATGLSSTGLGTASAGGGMGATSLGDFFSGNGNWNDYLRAGQAAYGMYAQDRPRTQPQQGIRRN